MKRTEDADAAPERARSGQRPKVPTPSDRPLDMAAWALLADGVSHELSNVFTALAWSVEAIAKSLPTEHARSLAEIHASIRTGTAATVRLRDAALACVEDIPVSRSSIPVEAAGPVRAPAKSVLIVDDNDSVRLLLTGYLEPLGWKVTSVSSGAAALDAMRGDGAVAAVALIDHQLPDRSGNDLARELRDLVPELRIVLVTSGRPIDIPFAAAPVLVKPVDLSRLATTLEELART